MEREWKRALIPLPIACLVVVVDALTKWAAVREVGPAAGHRSRWLIGDWLGLTYAENSGVAFGLLRGSSTGLLILAATATLLALAVFVWSNRDIILVLIAGGLIAGGALGNLLDRVRLGHVRDFIHIGPWPAFNIADSAITIGVLVAAWGLLRGGATRPASPSGTSGHTRQRDATFWT